MKKIYTVYKTKLHELEMVRLLMFSIACVCVCQTEWGAGGGGKRRFFYFQTKGRWHCLEGRGGREWMQPSSCLNYCAVPDNILVVSFCLDSAWESWLLASQISSVLANPWFGSSVSSVEFLGFLLLPYQSIRFNNIIIKTFPHHTPLITGANLSRA